MKPKLKTFKDRTGEKRITNEGYEIEIIEYFGNNNCTVKFEIPQYVILLNRRYNEFIKGSIRNPYHPSVYNIGYLGKGVYKTKVNSSTTKYYEVWKEIIRRCYNKVRQEKQPTYAGITVCEEWKNFQIFAEWFEKNYTEGFHVDKDILFKGNKIYSPEKCCFVPVEINSLFVKNDINRGDCPIGVSKRGKKYRAILHKYGANVCLGNFDTPEEAFQVYKTAKESHIKEVADNWKDQIEPRVYQALYAYKVEITD